jgi:hypothetical protein
LGILKVYKNIKREEAICYWELAYSEMIERRVEEEGPVEYPNDKVAVMDAAYHLGRYDQEHVNVAIWWQDETVTIHCGMPNDIYDMFLRLDGSLFCPVFAKGIRVETCLQYSEENSCCQHTFTIFLNKPDWHKHWTDPRLFFLNVADKDLDFDSEAQQEVKK